MKTAFELFLYVAWGSSVALILLVAIRHLRLFLSSRGLEIPSAAPVSDNSFLPFVTVQLPIRNEKNVVRSLLHSMFRLDYPSDRLEIQILDDSNDQTSSIIDDMVANYRGNASVQILRREKNVGFKAGALAYGLKTARGEFIVVFDADSTPDRDFLRRVLPPFRDPDVGMVQASLRFRNRDKNLLTRIQALLLESHMYIDQWGSSRNGQLFQFNGTSGVWRKSCLDDCGGWAFASLTEDLEISFRALARRWRFIQLPGVSVETELPETIGSYRSQQGRWSKGAAQVFKRLFCAQIWRVWDQGGMALLYAGRKSVSLFLVVLALALPFMKGSFLFETAVAATLFAYFCLLLCVYQSQKMLGRTGGEVFRCILPLASLIAGLSFSQAIHFVRGFFEEASDFVRTPKSGAEPVVYWYQPAKDETYLIEFFMAFLYFAALTLTGEARAFWSLSVLWLAITFLSVGTATFWSFHVRSYSWSR